MKYHSIIPLCLVFAGCGAKVLYNVEPAPAALATAPGIVYSLPKTVLQLRVEVEKTVTKVGPYAKYNDLLGFPSVTAATGTAYEYKGVSLSPLVVPDHASRFVITPESQNRLSDRGVTFAFTDEGFLTSGEATFHDRRAEFAVATVGAVASVAASAIGFATTGTSTKAATPAAVAPKDVHDEDPLKPCKKLLGNAADAGAVCAAAVRLVGLVQMRDEMLTRTKGQVTAAVFSAQLAAANAEISKLEGLFFATKTKSVKVWSFSLEPGSQTSCVSLDTAKGQLSTAATCHAGPANLEVALPTGNVAACSAVGGLVYRMPAEAEYSASIDGAQVAHGRALFPQLGVCASAPNTIKGKKGKLVVGLSKTTGMLTGFSIEETNDYSDIPKSLADSLNSILASGKSVAEDRAEAADEAAEEKREANDPLNIKQRELELLKIQREIDCFERFGQPCPDAASEDDAKE